MGMVGTFDGFTTARLGIYAAQKGLLVTGNNISNINTVGYTRQRLDQVSLKTGGNDMYRSHFDNHVGSGALVTSINQVRDPYLDIRYRNTASDVGYTDTWLNGLKEIADTLDEVGKGVESNKNDKGDGILYAQLRDLRDMLMQLHNDPTKANDTLVRNSAETLCALFNTYADKLETLHKNTVTDFDKQITSVNEILTNIRNLNETIREAEISGDNALEMRDERNRQIDALAEQMHIRVEYTMEDIGGGIQVEKLTIMLGDANPDPLSKTDSTILVDGIYGAQLSSKEDLVRNKAYIDDPNDPNFNDPTNLPYLNDKGEPCEEADAAKAPYTIYVSEMVDQRNIAPKPTELDLNKDRPIRLEDNDLRGSFQAMRELLTEKGEFSTQADVALDPKAATKRGIPYYQKSLDLLAKKFAETYNALNQGPLTDKDGNVIYKEQEGTPGELGLKEVETGLGAGYYVDANGYFVGRTDAAHQPECLLTKAQISVNDPLNKALQKIKDAGGAGSAWETQVNGVLDADGNIIPGKEADAETIFSDFLTQHGVDAAGNPADQPLKVNASVSPEGTGPLFSNRNDGDDVEGINASNISVSHSWSKGDVKVVPKFHELFDGDVEDSTQNTNIDHMISKIEEALTYNPKDLDPNAVSDKLFTGSFNDMFSNMATTLGNDRRTMNTQLNTHYTQLVDIDTNRDGVSGVDLNDEAMNMMQFQKAMNAAMRLMTAIDEAIDRLINNTGIAGR